MKDYVKALWAHKFKSRVRTFLTDSRLTAFSYAVLWPLSYVWDLDAIELVSAKMKCLAGESSDVGDTSTNDSYQAYHWPNPAVTTEETGKETVGSYVITAIRRLGSSRHCQQYHYFFGPHVCIAV
jgi:hypothetical protein